MADYVVTDIDKWLIRNKKDVVDLLRKQGKRIPDFDMAKYHVIMDLWNSTEHTTNTADKLRKWKDLQDKLGGIFKEAEKNIKTYDEKISKFKENPAFTGLQGESKDKYDFWSKLNDIGLSRPNASDEELQNLDVADVFKYNNRQLKYLASQYGYNYDDPEERKEFITKAGEVSRERDLDKIWAEDLYTTLFTPVAKEYARKNYDKINTESMLKAAGDLAPALAADVGINTLMAATPAKFGADLAAAPVARGVANMALNGRAPVDAAKEAISEGATNLATPYFLRLPFRWGKRGYDAVLQKTAEAGIKKNSQKALNTIAKDKIDETADKVYAIEKMLKEGAPIRTEKGNALRFSKDGKTVQRISEIDLPQINEGNSISMDDFRFYLQNKNLLRNRPWGPKPTDNKSLLEKAELYDPEMAKILKKGTTQSTMKKVKENIGAGKPATDGISAQDLAMTAGRDLKETKFNWAKHKAEDAYNSQLANDARSYITNLQGRSKYGGSLITTVSQAIPGVEKGIDLSVKETPDVKNDPELQLIQRMYKLHKTFPNMVNKPKLPKKWENDYTIEEIFGE